jgi:hypothetical protein
MKRQHTLITIAVVACWIGLTWAGQPSPTPPNWGQADVSDWTCPLFYPDPAPHFGPLPATVALTTGNGAVLVSLTLNSFTISGRQELLADFTLDGAPVGALVDWDTGGGGAGKLASLPRVIPVTSGTHNFGVAIACVTGGDAMVIERDGSASMSCRALAGNLNSTDACIHQLGGQRGHTRRGGWRARRGGLAS